MVDARAVEFVSDAQLDRLEAVEHVELGERERIDARDPDGLAQLRGIEPSTAPRPAGVDAEFLSTRAQRFAGGVGQFGEERATADPRRIRLRDTQHVAELRRTEPGAGRRGRCHGARRRHERVRAPVDVQHHGLRAFEQNALAAIGRVVEVGPDRTHERQDLRCERNQRRQHRVAIVRVEPQAAEPCIVMVDEHVELGREPARFREIADTQPATPDLVLVGRPDAAQRGADGLAAQPLLRLVDRAVNRQYQRRVLGDRQVVRRHRQPELGHPPDFREQRFGVERHPVADHAALAAHDAARQQRELVRVAADDQRVARVVPAVVACDEIGLCRQPVHDAPLAFVTPLGAHDHHVRHAPYSM